ncbi:MAG: single-stranded-DNA-specific exonuclease RecJ [Gemmataceae bacterium]
MAATAVLRRWRLLPHDRHAVDRLARALPTSPIVAQLLLNRGVADPDQARTFLTPALKGLHPPSELPGVPDAVERIFHAIDQGKRICVYGDYDVDGVTGSAILLQTLRLLGARPEHYVPHRLEEGYGLNRDALKQLADSGVGMVVTVDCGIASLSEAEEARKLGLELIVTDHHEMKDELPRASVLVHPRLPGSSYPFGQLCGAAVAFKLAWALAQRKCGGEKVTPAFRELLLDAVALAALGVVADVVPLLGENRILVRAGLARLAEKPPVGLQALSEVAQVALNGELRASDIGFRLAPRINAVGRLGQAEVAVELLTTTRRERAVDLARHFEYLNETRQKLERETVQKAKQLVETEGRQSDPALVLASPDWHGGIVGIVAGRLAEQFGRPALIITLPKPDSDLPWATGSGRSIPGVALHEALKACGDLLVSHGGHAAAAGFKVLPGCLDAFRERFCAHVAGCFPDGVPTPELVLDAETPLSALTVGLLNELAHLEPYGAENRKPLFLAGGLQVQGDPRKVGQGERHLSFRVRQGATTLKAIGWNMAERAGELMSAGGACCLAFTPKRNEWQGRVSVDLEVTDFRPGADAALV